MVRFFPCLYHLIPEGYLSAFHVNNTESLKIAIYVNLNFCVNLSPASWFSTLFELEKKCIFIIMIESHILIVPFNPKVKMCLKFSPSQKYEFQTG
jgi:hypothetical protein